MKNIKVLSIICISLLQTACMGLPTSKSTGNFPKPSIPSNLKDMPYEKWQDTESGRFAHSLQYEDKLAKPVPYTFTEGKDYRQESIDYFEHLCKTEGKDYIYKTVTGVDTIAQLRSFEIPFERQNNPNWGPQSYKFHPYALESPVFFNEVLAGTLDNSFRNKEETWLAPDSIRMFYGSAYKNYQIKFNNNLNYNFLSEFILRKKITDEEKSLNQYNLKDLIRARATQKIEKINAEYGFTWKGFSRPQDRDYGIAGGDLIVLNLKTNEILAVQRTFVKAAIQKNSPTGINWEGVGCFEQYKNETIIHKNLNLEGKLFDEKSKLVYYSSPTSSFVPAFLQKIINKEEKR